MHTFRSFSTWRTRRDHRDLRLAERRRRSSFAWGDESRPCQQLSDILLTLDWPRCWNLRPGFPFFLENAFALLDRPSEWYLDRQTGKLNVIPPNRNKAEWILAEKAVPFFALTNETRTTAALKPTTAIATPHHLLM